MTLLQKFLADVCRDVDIRLDELLPAAGLSPTRLHEAIRWSVFAGGKRFRPALMIAVGESLGAERGRLMTTAAAIEMIHTYSLIHDDLPSMDDDDLRRGQATCHIKFDEATAILAGDVLQSLAFGAIADDLRIDSDVRVRLISLIASAAATPNGMVAGQQLDLEAEGEVLSVEALADIHRKKTGALISASAIAGAILANADDPQIAAIREFSENLGLLFQVTDDLLDATQQSAELGKTAGKDAAAEKATYATHYGIDAGREMAEAIRLEAIAALSPLTTDTTLLREISDFVAVRGK